MTISGRLRAEITKQGLSEGELHRRSGVPQPTIHRILTGESLSPRRGSVERIAKALRVSPDWLFFGTEQTVPKSSIEQPAYAPDYHGEERLETIKKIRRYPLISWVAAGNWQESHDNYAPGDADEWIETPANAGQHGYWLTVSGPSMEPRFSNGTQILVRPEGFDLISGKFYIARLVDTGETTFKKYIRDSGNEYLQPLNMAFPIMPITSNVQIIGRVIAAQHPSDDF